MKFIVACDGQAAVGRIIDQLSGVLGFLVFERHRVNDAFDVMSGLLASGLFSQFLERAGPWNKHVDEVAAHRSSDSSQGTKRDAVFRFGIFKLLDSLPRYSHLLANQALAKAESLAHRCDPSIGRTRWQCP